MQARAVLEYSSSLTSGPSWGLDTFPHFCKLPSSVIPFSRKRIRASEPTRVLSPVFSSPGSLAVILLWLPLQSALCSIPIPLFSFRKAAFQPYRSVASHQNQHIFREREREQLQSRDPLALRKCPSAKASPHPSSTIPVFPQNSQLRNKCFCTEKLREGDNFCRNASGLSQNILCFGCIADFYDFEVN